MACYDTKDKKRKGVWNEEEILEINGFSAGGYHAVSVRMREEGEQPVRAGYR